MTYILTYGTSKVERNKYERLILFVVWCISWAYIHFLCRWTGISWISSYRHVRYILMNEYNSDCIILLLQKRSTRIINNSPYNTHALPLFSKLNQLTIFDLNQLSIATFMLRHYKNCSPNIFAHCFVRFLPFTVMTLLTQLNCTFRVLVMSDELSD